MKKNGQIKRAKDAVSRPLTLDEKIADQLRHLESMSASEGRRRLLRAGIITADGQLAPPYR